MITAAANMTNKTPKNPPKPIATSIRRAVLHSDAHADL